MSFGIKRSKADGMFSDFIRYRDNWRCVRCKRQHEVKKNTLDCSHYWARSNKGTRFDPLNADSLCRYPCHQGKDSTIAKNFGWEYQKQIYNQNGCQADGAYTTFKRNQLGHLFDILLVSAHTPTKIDELSIEMWLKQELEIVKGKKLFFKDYK